MPPQVMMNIFGGYPDRCPFCNSENVALYCGPEPHVTCMKCGADGPPADRDIYEQAAQYTAILKWNERT